MLPSKARVSRLLGTPHSWSIDDDKRLRHRYSAGETRAGMSARQPAGTMRLIFKGTTSRAASGGSKTNTLRRVSRRNASREDIGGRAVARVTGGAGDRGRASPLTFADTVSPVECLKFASETLIRPHPIAAVVSTECADRQARHRACGPRGAALLSGARPLPSATCAPS